MPPPDPILEDDRQMWREAIRYYKWTLGWIATCLTVIVILLIVHEGFYH